MIIILNGKETELDHAMTIFAMLEHGDIAPQTVVVERNGEIVPGELFAATVLNDGDQLEVLRFVGGG